MNILLNLTINSTDSLQLITEAQNIEDMNLYNIYFSIWLKQNKNMLKLHKFAVGHDLYDFSEQIKCCMKNKNKISTKICNADLGLLWNEHNQKIILAEEKGNPLKNWRWTESHLLFFGNNDHLASSTTFLYNDDIGNIIFQVSSIYPWFFGEETPQVSYEQWIDQYKVLYKTTISKQLAEQWVEQLQDLYQKLENNMPF